MALVGTPVSHPMLPQLGGNRASGNLGGGFRPAEGMASNGMVYNPAVENMYRGNLGGTAPVYPANTPAIHDRNVIQNAADAIHPPISNGFGHVGAVNPPISMGFGHAGAQAAPFAETLQNLLSRLRGRGVRESNPLVPHRQSRNLGNNPMAEILAALGS